MKKRTKITLTIGALALALGLGLSSNLQIMAKIDPPFGLVNLK